MIRQVYYLIVQCVHALPVYSVHELRCRKERKMFETYQQQARTARDKKDKEDITALRNEVGCVCMYNMCLIM